MRRLTPSMVVAILALLVSLAGGAIAASTLLPANSVGTRQIINHSIKKVDLGTPLPRGRRGPAGAMGLQGPTGPAGIATVTTVDSAPATMCAGGGGGCQVAGPFASCPSGSLAVGGGWESDSIDLVVPYAKRTATPNYSVIAINYDSAPRTIKAHVICAVGPAATIAAESSATARRAFDKALSRTKAELSRADAGK
jgi:hypothetical protein